MLDLSRDGGGRDALLAALVVWQMWANPRHGGLSYMGSHPSPLLLCLASRSLFNQHDNLDPDDKWMLGNPSYWSHCVQEYRPQQNPDWATFRPDIWAEFAPQQGVSRSCYASSLVNIRRWFQRLALATCAPCLVLPLVSASESATQSAVPTDRITGLGSLASFLSRSARKTAPVSPAPSTSVRISDLHWAALEGDPAEVERLIRSGADVSEKESGWGATALHWASSRRAVKALLRAGADIEAVDDAGDTPLTYAVLSPSLDAIVELLLSGANPDAVNFEGLTPLQLAITVGSPVAEAVIPLLRRFGADPNVRSGPGSMTPLLLGIMAGGLRGMAGTNLLALTALANEATDPKRRPIDANIRSDHTAGGVAALHLAVLPGIAGPANRLMLITWLIEMGADVNLRSADGLTALQIAENWLGADDPTTLFLREASNTSGRGGQP